MTFAEKVLRRPRLLWVWKLNFQLHLWAGLVLTLYLVLIGTTGSILVFRVELERLSGLSPWPVAAPVVSGSDLERAIAKLRVTYPAERVLSILIPTPNEPSFVATLQGVRGRWNARVDPSTMAISRIKDGERSWLDILADLHATLLAGRKGRMANGAGGALLLLINVTGLVIWWPGLKTWKRGLIIDFRRTWRRINFDLHKAAGFWTFAIVSFWAISAIYFGWPAQVFAFVNKLSPVRSARPPLVRVPPVMSVNPPRLPDLIAKAQSLDPGTKLVGISFPYSRRAPFEILMQRSGGRGREYMDMLYFSPWDGSHLQTWRYGVNETIGDWIIWLQVPLHYGTYWGLVVKILWALLGASLPVLSITGAVLYWNRVLRHKLRTREPVQAATFH